MTTVAQFDGQQFSEEEVAAKVMEQYDGELVRKFYKIVMGGGGYDIHYGIYRDDSYTVKEASQATTDFMLDMLDWNRPINEGSKVLDLGSGHGGAMHTLVKRFNCFVQGFNLSSQQNDMNLEECKKLGIADKVALHAGNMNNGLPKEWEGTFDAVFSSEVLCHAADKNAILKEIHRVLKPGGVLVFSDIMGADDADEKDLKTFTDRNATTKMARPQGYIASMKEANLKYIAWVDLSHHLLQFYKQMLGNVEDKYDALKSSGLSDEYLGNWKKSLSERCECQEATHCFAWGVMCAMKE